MRTFVAWLLVVVASAYLLGGYLCFRGMYAVAVEKPMTVEEQAIVEKLKLETGLHTQVKMLSDEQLNARGTEYISVLVFSEEVDGEEVYYVIDQYPMEIVHVEYLIGRYSDPERQNNQNVLLARLFFPFIINEVSVSEGPRVGLLSACNFRFTGLRDLFISSIPTPPPRFA